MITLEKLRKNLIYEFNSEHDERKAIKKIFEIFNFSREDIGEYVLDKRAVAAYTLFYGSTNYQKWSVAMDRLDDGFIKEMLSGDIIEIGTGPGTFAMAFRDWLSEKKVEFKHTWFGVDQSELMLEQAQKLVTEEEFQFQKKIPSIEGATVFFSHSINEMEKSTVLRMIGKLKPKRIIWIEPGTKSFFSKANELRSSLISEAFQILSPCLGDGECPAAKVEGEWCHQIFRVKHADCVERLCQQLERDRRTMPVSFHVYQKCDVVRVDQTATLFHKRRKTKHSFEWTVCLEEAGEMRLVEFEVTLRGLNRQEIKELDGVECGELVGFEVVKELAEKRRRVSVQIAYK